VKRAERLERDHEAACVAYLQASAEYEAAIMSGPDRGETATRYAVASLDYSRTLQALVRSRRPDFLALLADPATPISDDVARSIDEYQNAPSCTAGLRVGDPS
jgi:hypothetical protein